VTAQNIEVITLTRGERDDDYSRPHVSGGGHTVYAPWPVAELEVRRRVLRSLSERTTPPEGVAFVRSWEPAPAPIVALDIDDPPRPRGRRGR
jgi:hypothetical protein